MLKSLAIDPGNSPKLASIDLLALRAWVLAGSAGPLCLAKAMSTLNGPRVDAAAAFIHTSCCHADAPTLGFRGVPMPRVNRASAAPFSFLSHADGEINWPRELAESSTSPPAAAATVAVDPCSTGRPAPNPNSTRERIIAMCIVWQCAYHLQGWPHGSTPC